MCFSYFGSKSNIVHLYPPPSYQTVIEPFCGSARYACRYYNRDVWINDVYPVIYRIWKWIQGASKQDVRTLPELKPSEDLRDFKQLSDVERELMGFAVCGGVASPRNKFTSNAARRLLTSGTGAIVQLKNNLLRLVGNIGHWKITNLDYKDISSQEATWFVDPPYQGMGNHYIHGNDAIDYQDLGTWCKNLLGQVVVCEYQDASWLPFRKFNQSCYRTTKVGTGSRQEVVWTQNNCKMVGFGLPE